MVTARPHATRHLAVVRKRLATSLPRRRETGNKYQPLTCRRHPNNATYTRSPIRIGRLFFLYVEAEGGAETLREALASRRLQLLLVIYVVCGFQDFLVATHMVAFALDEGVDTLLAGNMFAFMGLTGLAGVLLAGVLNDRFGPVLPTTLCFTLRTVLCALLLLSREPAVIVGAALLYGVTFWMTAPLAVVFARESASIALLGTVSGLITMVHHVAGGIGALAGASIFDAYGSYTYAFVAMLILSVVALGLILVLPRRTLQ